VRKKSSPSRRGGRRQKRGKDRSLNPWPGLFLLFPYPYGDAGFAVIYAPETNHRKCARYAGRKRIDLRSSYRADRSLLSDALREGGASKKGGKVGVLTGKAIALTAYDLLKHPERVKQVQEIFKELKEKEGK